MKHWFLLFVILLLGCQSSKHQSKDSSTQDDLINIAERFYQRGLVSGTGGDISVRLPGSEKFLIKATGNCLGDLDDDKLVIMALDGEILEEGKKPSHEAEIHRIIYTIHDEVTAIMHMHSPYATAWASVGKMVPSITQQSVKLLKDAAMVSYYPVGSPELVKLITDAFQNPQTQVVFLQNHGTFIVGKNLHDLLYNAEVVENTAKIAYFAYRLGTPVKFDF